MRISLLVQYDGSQYYGWQVQPDPKTVQGEIERALFKLFDVKIRLHGSGRTDSGVHALGQVAHFDITETPIPAQNMWKALNRYLPRDIRILSSQQVLDDFHSRFNAIQREYRYEICQNQNILRRNMQWQVSYDLDMGNLDKTTELVRGIHDFSSFCFAGTDTENMICDISDAYWLRESDGSLSFTIRANRFLHHMVRMLVGNMIEVGRGKWDMDHFTSLLEHPDPQAVTVSAPAQGLALIKVSYPMELQPDWSASKQSIASPARTG